VSSRPTILATAAAVSVVRLILMWSLLPAEQPVMLRPVFVVSQSAFAVAFRVIVTNESAVLNAVSSVMEPFVGVQAVAIRKITVPDVDASKKVRRASIAPVQSLGSRARIARFGRPRSPARPHERSYLCCSSLRLRSTLVGSMLVRA
jgi:hypothetical protein